MSLSDGLYARYELEETSGTAVADSSGHGNTATANADMSGLTATGAIGNGAQFVIANDNRITTPLSLSFASDFSVSVWIAKDNAQTIGNAAAIVGSGWGSASVLEINADASAFTIAAGGFTNGVTAARLIPIGNALDGDEHHLAVSWDATAKVATVYLDGVVLSVEPISTPSATSFAPWIGDRNATLCNFGGLIDDVWFWNRTIASYEVAQLVALGPAELADVALRAHWAMDETAGNVLRSTPSVLALDDDFTTVGSNDSNGDVPPDAIGYTGAWTTTTGGRTIDANGFTIQLDNSAGSSTAYFGVKWPTILEPNRKCVISYEYKFSVNGDHTHGTFNGATNYWNYDDASDWTEQIFVVDSGTAGDLWLRIRATAGTSSTGHFRNFSVRYETAATLVGDTIDNVTEPGVLDRAVRLSGTNYAKASIADGFTYPKSFACWYRLNTLTTAAVRTLLSLADESDATVYWRLGVANTGTGFYVNRRNTTDVGTTFTQAQDLAPHHVALVFHDDSSFSLYFDGALLTYQSGLTAVPESANVDTLIIGLLRLNAPTQYADDVTIDDVWLYDRELGPDEIAALYAAGNFYPAATARPTLNTPIAEIGVAIAPTDASWDAGLADGYSWQQASNPSGSDAAEVATTANYTPTTPGKYLRRVDTQTGGLGSTQAATGWIGPTTSKPRHCRHVEPARVL